MKNNKLYFIIIITCSVICGLTAFTTKNHIIRAALETVCFQITDVIEAMKKDAGIHLTKLHVDGTMVQNNLLMQLQADISGIPICKLLAYQKPFHMTRKTINIKFFHSFQ